MTVQQLIEVLQKFPPDLRVVIPGFDGSGLDDVETVETIKVKFTSPLGVVNQPEGEAGVHSADLSGEDAVLLNW